MDIMEKLVGGEPARLIPILAEGKKEERASSALLATISIVPDFAKKLLEPFNVKIGSRTTIECFTEVRFDEYEELRPDGLIVVRNGKKVWTAIVESKVGTAKLEQTQFDNYANLARKCGVDALITFSNQYAVRSDHHPLAVPNKTLKFIQVGHISWLAVKSEALLLCSNRGLDDPEQAFILTEFLRFLSHDASGVSSTISLSSAWPEVLTLIQSGISFRGKDSQVFSAVGDWHQLSKFTSLELAMRIERPVSIEMSSKRMNDPDFNFKEDVDLLKAKQIFTTQYQVFGCDSSMKVKLDLSKKTLEIETPRLPILGGKGSKASVSWVVKQAQEMPELDPIFKIYWPRQREGKSLDFSLSDFVNKKRQIELPPQAKKEPPTSFVVSIVVDLGADIKRSKRLIDTLSGSVANFYDAVLKDLKVARIATPKVVNSHSAIDDGGKDVSEPNVSVSQEVNQGELNSRRSSVFFRILPVRNRRYLDDRYN